MSILAKDLMSRDPLRVTPDTPVAALARALLAAETDGACVVEGGQLVGVVTAMDLIFQEKQPHIPAVFALMDALIPLERPGRARRELEKISGVEVRTIMSSPAISASPEATLAELATLMVEDHLTLLPIIEDGALVGAVSRWGVLRSALSARSAERVSLQKPTGSPHVQEDPRPH